MMSSTDFQLLFAHGPQARLFVDEIAKLRITIFREYPYLYAGTLSYERQYLDAYIQSERSLFIIVKCGSLVVGAATGLPLSDAEESIRKPLQNFGLDPDEIFYSGETLLLPAFRDQGIGKHIMPKMEQYAQQLGAKRICFFTVVRPPQHPLRPVNYREPDAMWQALGCNKVHGLTTTYRWRDIDQATESDHLMQYWLKDLAD